MNEAKKGLARLACITVLAVATLLAPLAPGALAQKEIEAFYIVSELQGRYRGIRTVSADFTQEFRAFGFDKPMITAGRVYFKKPGKMKWIYRAGSADVLTSDGTTVWLFQPDLAQVVETRADFGSTLATDFLSGIGSLKDDFIIRLEKEDKKAYVLDLEPVRPQPNVKRLLLHVDKSQRVVTRTVVEDFFGNSTQVTFSGIELNMPIEDSFFVFKPPPGVTVVKE